MRWCGLYHKDAWGTASTKDFRPRNAGIAWEEHSGCCRAQTAGGGSEPNPKRLQQAGPRACVLAERSEKCSNPGLVWEVTAHSYSNPGSQVPIRDTQWPMAPGATAASGTDSEALQSRKIWKLLVGQMVEELVSKWCQLMVSEKANEAI